MLRNVPDHIYAHAGISNYIRKDIDTIKIGKDLVNIIFRGNEDWFLRKQDW